MPTLSLILIVKNEARHLARCLDSAKDLVNEIIIVDSGSSDETLEIAAQYGAHCYVHSDWQGFGKQRQIAQQYATSEYVLWLDADEYLSVELAQSIREHLANNTELTAYYLNRLSSFLGKDIRYSGWYPDTILRLYPRELAQYNDNKVHESVVLMQKLPEKTLSGDLYHTSYTSLAQYTQKSQFYAQLWAQQKYAQGKRSSLTQAIVHAIGCFLKMYLFKRGFLDGKHGFLLAILSAQSVFLKYASLWAAQHEAA